MHFLGDVDVVCPDCEGRRFNDGTLAVRDRGQIDPRRPGDERRGGRPLLRRRAPARSRPRGPRTARPRLSQARPELDDPVGRRGPAGQAGLGDEPVGAGAGPLHPGGADDGPPPGRRREPPRGASRSLVSLGRTIIAVEHHPDVIRAADRVVDLGPGSGEDGGRVVACGTPDEIAACAAIADRAGPARGVCGGRRARGTQGEAAGSRRADRPRRRLDAQPQRDRRPHPVPPSSRPSADRRAAASPRSSSIRSSPRPGRGTSRASPPTPGRSSTRAGGPTSPPPGA
ncbi:MAG: hypothetical protein MZU84_08580 [Sphingobacterium sp.]|nr:hypothetical protein [Sphingobacterium sp.]